MMYGMFERGIQMVGLIIILVLVLFLPFLVKTVEHQLESFLFIMGILAALISGVLNRELWEEALHAPIGIAIAVFISGLLFKWLQTPFEKAVDRLSQKVSLRFILPVVVIGLGLISSIITAIIAALILVMIVTTLKLDRPSEVRFVIFSSFSIGLGASLTPIGEPLSTLTVTKLNKDFFYLIKLIGPYVFSAIVIFAVLTFIFVTPRKKKHSSGEQTTETYAEIVIRTFKIYLFVMGLTLLGAGFEPLINRYLLDLHTGILYWVNMISAVLDNATLAAAEISPAISDVTIQAILLGLLISGGMLIPGNIPNIIAAGKLQITSKEWAKIGVPVGLVTMVLYYLVIFIFH
jgi:predicted cation transporter